MDNAECVLNDRELLRKAENHISKLILELKEREAEKEFYLKENAFLKESLRRIVGL